jgi:hypothetical protein
MTAEAIVLHTIDNLDAKLAQLRQAASEGGGFQFLRGFGRFLYLPLSNGQSEPDEEDESGDPEQLELGT